MTRHKVLKSENMESVGKVDLFGLTNIEVISRQKQYGKNELNYKNKENFILKTIKMICQPMFLLLLGAAIIYFILGEARDGIIMIMFVLVIISIDVIQEWKTDKTLEALKDLSQPKVKVIRNGKQIEISSVDLVVDDLVLLYEGVKVPADGIVIKTGGISVNESILTGESVSVNKILYDISNNYDTPFRNDSCYAGTLVVQGSAILKITKIGNNTEYGKIGNNISNITKDKTLLEKQTSVLIKFMTILAFILCFLTILFTFLNLGNYSFSERITTSILSGITLAMAMIPEEYPVVLTVFLSMGAWRLAKKNSLVKKMSSIETLGSISVLCVDKTGTITKNQMEVSKYWTLNGTDKDLFETIGLCCDENLYDPMEQALINKCEEYDITVDHLFGGKVIKRFPFSNESKMTGTYWQHENLYLLATKGSLESIMSISNLNEKDKDLIINNVNIMTKQGLRVIAVAKKIYSNIEDIDNNLHDLQFRGIVGLIDPPKDDIKNNIEKCYQAGIRVIMITGDSGDTASSIASSVGIKNSNKYITGKELKDISFETLKETIKDNNIFCRVVPEDKMQIIKALKANGEIVAMTGDGVNDAPALKYADIGVSMGKKGSEVAREASDLILMDDNFSTIVDTVHDGRRIYDNIKRAIYYIITVHIPIALTTLISSLWGITPSDLMLLPVHIVLFELIIDPTCSIVLERVPSSHNIMNKKPRSINENILTFKGLIKSLIQGIVIFVSSFLTFYVVYKYYNNVEVARTMGLFIIIFSNLFLVLVNSSDNFFIKDLKRMFKDKVLLGINVIIFISSLILIYSPINKYLKLASLSLWQLIFVILCSFVSVFWYEIFKKRV